LFLHGCNEIIVIRVTVELERAEVMEISSKDFILFRESKEAHLIGDKEENTAQTS